MPELTIRDLVWSFSPHTAPFLRIADLTIPTGSLVAVTGPSGSGKSTFLSLLAGLDRPSAGSLVWGDVDLATQAPRSLDRWRRHNLGMVFQDFQLIPQLTALENVLLPQTFFRWSIPLSVRREAQDLLVGLGVERFSAPAQSLSRGEMQRTALARALLAKPSVLLADEPTASLDAENERVVTDLLVDYGRRTGATLLVATHHPYLRDIADRSLILDHGTFQGAAP